jgi:hypothetical protein
MRPRQAPPPGAPERRVTVMVMSDRSYRLGRNLAVMVACEREVRSSGNRWWLSTSSYTSCEASR